MRDNDDLSERQRGLLLFIEEYMREHGRPPTNREIGNGLGIPSTGHVDYHLKALENKGYISRQKRTSRGIQVLAPLHAPVGIGSGGIPIMGTIAAGQPLDLFQGHRDVLESVNPAIYSEKVYALRVSGNSMIEDGIFDGDYVVIDPSPEVNTRDIIVATNLGSGESGAATLKRFFRDGNRIRLQPANKDFNPIYVDADEWDHSWEVQGRVAAVVRMY
jgi:repressor LexA